MKKLFAILLATIAILMFVPTSAAKADSAQGENDEFSIIWIADTQAIAYYDYPGAFEIMGAWIMEQQEPKNVRYIVQTGDAVDNGHHPWQWRNYYLMYNQFAGKIPYIGIAGNHELGVKYPTWDSYLALPEVQAIPETNKYHGGKAQYATFEYAGEKFIIAGIGYSAIEECDGWLNSVLKAHSDYTAILIFHSYLRNAEGYMRVGEQIFETIVKSNANVKLVLSGHVSKGGNAFRQEQLDDNGDGTPDRTVTAMMYNYQSWSENCGQLRTLTFNMIDRSITVTTYSPVTGKYFGDHAHDEQPTFTIPHAF